MSGLPNQDAARWLAAAARLAARGVPASRPNPAVGAIIVNDGAVVGRGWTQPGGRPHAEAMALVEAGDEARGATLYVTLEPCAHQSARGPACAALIAASGLARVVVGCEDPDPRTAGYGLGQLAAAGIAVEPLTSDAAKQSLAPYFTRAHHRRPLATLKLALSLDGALALANGSSRWITGPEARAHAHGSRARMDAILVGGGTLRADAPRLDVRLAGLEGHAPERWLLTRGAAPAGWLAVADPTAIIGLSDAQSLLVEGGAGAAAAFLAADLIDRLMIYRAPIVIGGGRGGVDDIGLVSLAAAHGRWALAEARRLGSDTLEVYHRTRN